MDSSSSDNLPTSQFEQLLNSQKVNTVTNADYIKPDVPDVKKSSSASISDKDFLNDINGFLKPNDDKNDDKINNNNFNDLFNNIKNDIPDDIIKDEKQEERENRSPNGITTEIDNIINIKDNEAKEYKINSEENKRYDKDYKFNEIQNDPQNYQTYQSYQPEISDNEEIDEYESLSKSKKKLARMDMLRKLADLKKKGYLITDDYNIDSDYYVMKEEYEYQMSIKGKDGFVKNSFCYGLSLIKMLEFANKKYDPFGIDLDGWNSNLECSKEEILDTISDIYEKYHKPGSGTMAPELRLLIILISSAASTVIANSGAKMLASMFKTEPIIKENEKEDILKNLNMQINQNNPNPNLDNIKNEKCNVVSNDINKVQNEIKDRNYSIPIPEVPQSLNQDSTNNIFNDLIKNQKNSKKMF